MMWLIWKVLGPFSHVWPQILDHIGRVAIILYHLVASWNLWKLLHFDIIHLNRSLRLHIHETLDTSVSYWLWEYANVLDHHIISHIALHLRRSHFVYRVSVWVNIDIDRQATLVIGTEILIHPSIVSLMHTSEVPWILFYHELIVATLVHSSLAPLPPLVNPSLATLTAVLGHVVMASELDSIPCRSRVHNVSSWPLWVLAILRWVVRVVIELRIYSLIMAWASDCLLFDDDLISVTAVAFLTNNGCIMSPTPRVDNVFL